MVSILTEAELLGKAVLVSQKTIVSVHINSVISYCVIAILFICKEMKVAIRKSEMKVAIHKSVYMLVGLESITL
jgi:hypothetical protein